MNANERLYTGRRVNKPQADQYNRMTTDIDAFILRHGESPESTERAQQLENMRLARFDFLQSIAKAEG